MPERTVTVNVTDSQIVNINQVDIRKTNLEVTAENVSNKLFIFHRKYEGLELRDKFVAVASVSDLENIPEDTPTDTTGMYRTSEMTLYTDMPYKLDEVIDDIKRRMRTLLQSLKELETPFSTYDFTISV